jgi:hypothetical protein
MQNAIRQANKFTLHIHWRDRHKVTNDVLTWGYLLTTGPRCGGLLSVGAYKSYELAEAAARRMVASLQKATA